MHVKTVQSIYNVLLQLGGLTNILAAYTARGKPFNMPNYGVIKKVKRDRLVCKQQSFSSTIFISPCTNADADKLTVSQSPL